MSQVLVVPIGLAQPTELLPVLERQLKRRLGLGMELAEPSFDAASCFSAPRRQHDALALLAALGSQAGQARVLGLTDYDLFLSIFTHVLGAAQLDGTAAVVSTHRLRPETVGLPPDPALLEERMVKEAVHELGHTFGLRHCHDPACAMFAANNADEVDLRSAEYRGNCLSRFHSLRASV